MLKQGIHPKIVQEGLGHASIQITLDTYSHVAPGLQEAAAARFNEVFSAEPEGENAGKIYELFISFFENRDLWKVRFSGF